MSLCKRSLLVVPAPEYGVIFEKMEELEDNGDEAEVEDDLDRVEHEGGGERLSDGMSREDEVRRVVVVVVVVVVVTPITKPVE